jgi:hypothetical protein
MGKNQSASGLTNIIQYDNNGNISFVSGSTTLMQISSSGAITTTGVISGSSVQSASLAQNSNLLQGTGSVGFATTASFTTASGSISTRVTQIEQVYATTGSNSFRATQSITGSLTVTGQIVAQTLNVQQVTSSIVFSSGSNTFGCDLNSRQTFTGSMFVTGGLTVNTTGPELQVNNNGVILGNVLTDRHGITGSFFQTGSVAIFSSCVGIGTTSPGTRLEVLSRAADADRTIPHNVLTITAEQGNAPYGFFGGAILFKNRSYTSGLVESSRIRSVIYDDGAPNNCGGGIWFETTTTPGGTLTPSLVINYAGNVGIGTCTPTAKLQIIAPESTSGLNSFGVVGQNNSKSIQLGATSSYAWIQSHGSVPLRINELGNNVLIATGGANVGIGITNPSTTLHVAGTNNTAVSNSTFWSFSFAGQEITNLSNTTGTVAGLALLGGASRSAVSAIGNILESTSLGALGFFTGGSGVGGGTVPERMRITSDGYLRLASRGIQFNGDTADANSLDDYEEGTWTPVYQDSTSTPSYITQFGRYTKIGRLVHVVGKISASNLGGGNAIIIGGLPFSAADASDSAQRVSIRPEGDWSGFGSLFTTTLFRANGANFQGVRDNGSGQSIFARYNEYSGTLYFNFNATYYV